MPITASLLQDVGDALAAEIASFDLDVPTTAPAIVERAIAPSFDLEELNEVHVCVVTTTEERTQITRGGVLQRDVTADIGVLCRVEGGETTDADAVLLVVDQVAAGLQAASNAGVDLADFEGAKLISLKRSDPAYDIEAFRKSGLMATSLLAVYRVVEAS